MPMNRVQFQPGLSMREFLSLHGTKELCEAALIARRRPRGVDADRKLTHRGWAKNLDGFMP